MTDSTLLPLSPEDVEDFIRNGYLQLSPDVAPDLHEAIYARAKDVGPRAMQIGDGILGEIPELHEVFACPRISGALSSLLGRGYVMHDHRHLHESGSNADQMWHQDSYWGFRRPRHHRPRWCMVMYYPQATTLEMGPTYILHGSQYWSLDSDHKLQGEDILMPDGEIPKAVNINSLNQKTSEDRARFLDSSREYFLGEYAELAPQKQVVVPAGACLLLHYDLWHRASSRSSDEAPSRFMFKFQFLRTAEPVSGETATLLSPKIPSAPEELRHIWDDVREWLGGGGGGGGESGENLDERIISAAVALLSSPREMVRVGAAYRLGRSTSWAELVTALSGPDEGAARAASYGLAAVGPEVVARVMPLLSAAAPRTRCLAAFVLGEVAAPNAELVAALGEALRNEWRRSVQVPFLEALTLVASRARSQGRTDICEQCLEISSPFLQPPTCFRTLAIMRGIPAAHPVEAASQVAFMAGGPRGSRYAALHAALGDVTALSWPLSSAAFFARSALSASEERKSEGRETRGAAL